MASGLVGVAALEKKLLELGSVVSTPILRSAVRAGIQPAKARAEQLIPVGVDAHRTYKGRLVAPGFAKRSIRTVTRVSEDKTRVSAALGVRKEAHYAVNFVEVGTSKSQAHPWLRPALESTKAEQESALAAKLKERIDKVTK